MKEKTKNVNEIEEIILPDGPITENTEKIFLHYDGVTGDIISFFHSSLHGNNIPEPNIEITPERHSFYMEHNGWVKLNPVTLEDEFIQVKTPNKEEQIKSELATLDADLPRAIEDLIVVMNVDKTKLPSIMQERLQRKEELRKQLKNLTH